MKRLIPILFASMLFTQAASAATFTVEQLNLPQLTSKENVELVKAGGNLAITTYRGGETNDITSYVYAHKELFGVDLGLTDGQIMQTLNFNGYAYIQIRHNESFGTQEIWRTPNTSLLQWEKVTEVSYYDSPLMKIGNKLVIFKYSGNEMLVSKNGTQWSTKEYSDIRKKDSIQTTSIATGINFQHYGYAAVLKKEGALALYRSSNAIDWTEVATTVFTEENAISSIGASFKWNGAIYMLTTNENGITQWWKSTDGDAFSEIEWNIPGNEARLMYKDSENLLLTTYVDGTIGWTMWHYTVGSEWESLSGIEGTGLNNSALGSDYIYTGMKYKKAWYVITEDRIPESGSTDANFNLLRITKE